MMKFAPVLDFFVKSKMTYTCDPDWDETWRVHLDPESLSSYRPISNLNYVSKLVEHAVAAQLTTYLSVTC